MGARSTRMPTSVICAGIPGLVLALASARSDSAVVGLLLWCRSGAVPASTSSNPISWMTSLRRLLLPPVLPPLRPPSTPTASCPRSATSPTWAGGLRSCSRGGTSHPVRSLAWHCLCALGSGWWRLLGFLLFTVGMCGLVGLHLVLEADGMDGLSVFMYVFGILFAWADRWGPLHQPTGHCPCG